MVSYETYLNGERRHFDSLKEAESYMTSNGLEYADSRECGHPTQERRYYLPVGAMEKYQYTDDAFNDLYGDGYEPSITPKGDDPMLMNPATGSVAPESEWRSDFEDMSAEEWGGDTFESAGLIEVVPDGAGWWREV